MKMFDYNRIGVYTGMATITGPSSRALIMPSLRRAGASIPFCMVQVCLFILYSR